jgi:dolichol kinase
LRSEIKKEFARKAIHFAGLAYIPAYIYFGKELVLAGITFLLSFAFFMEFLRIKFNLFGFLARDYERQTLGAHIYFGISALIITYVFPSACSIFAISTSIFGDGLAGIVKRLSTRSTRNWASVAMFLASLTLALFLSSIIQMNVFAAIISIMIATLIERIDRIGGIYVNDNLSVPLTAAFIYYSVNYFFPS